MDMIQQLKARRRMQLAKGKYHGAETTRLLIQEYQCLYGGSSTDVTSIKQKDRTNDKTNNDNRINTNNAQCASV